MFLLTAKSNLAPQQIYTRAHPSTKITKGTADKDPRAQKPQGINNYRAVLTIKRKQKAVNKKPPPRNKAFARIAKKATGE